MKIVEKSARTLATASEGNPLSATFTVVLFYGLFNMFEITVEVLIFSQPFAHFLDPFFAACFIAYAAYAVWHCALFHKEKINETENDTDRPVGSRAAASMVVKARP